MEKCKSMTPKQCAAYCDSMGCSADEKNKCMEMCKGNASMPATAMPSLDVATMKGMYIINQSHSFVDFKLRHLLTDAKGSLAIDTAYFNLTDDLTTSKVFIQLDAQNLLIQKIKHRALA